MKKRLFLIILGMLFMVTNVWAAGTVTQALTSTSSTIKKLVFTCTGDASGGSIPDTDTTSEITGKIEGFYVYRAIVNNTTSQTDTSDDADVYILDADGNDLLNAQGVGQLDADTANYIRLNRKDPIIGILTLDVNSQSEVSAVYTVTLILAK